MHSCTPMVLFLLLLEVLVCRCNASHNCILLDKSPGVCLPLTRCPTAIQLTKQLQYFHKSMQLSALREACVSHLGSEGGSVCCESPKQPLKVGEDADWTTTSTTRSPQASKPIPRRGLLSALPTTTLPTKQPSIRNVLPVTCGRLPPIELIWSDTEDEENVHTWAVFLVIFKPGMNVTGRCVGTLITERYVLTAAHCIHNRFLEHVTLYFGIFATTEMAPCSEPCQERKPDRIVPYHSYHEHNKLNDIALIRVAEPVTMTSFVSPICLPLNHTFDDLRSADETDSGEPPTLMSFGWGDTVEGVPSETKRVVQLRVISRQDCVQRLQYIRGYNATILASFICTMGVQKNHDVCHGDSGAPLLQFYDKRVFVVGVVSNGPKCGQGVVPGISMRLSEYMNWILTTIRS